MHNPSFSDEPSVLDVFSGFWEGVSRLVSKISAHRLFSGVAYLLSWWLLCGVVFQSYMLWRAWSEPRLVGDPLRVGGIVNQTLFNYSQFQFLTLPCMISAFVLFFYAVVVATYYMERERKKAQVEGVPFSANSVNPSVPKAWVVLLVMTTLAALAGGLLSHLYMTW